MAAQQQPTALLDPSIFASLEAKLDEETQVRDALAQTVQRLERAVAAAQGLLSRVHSTPRARFPELAAQVEKAVGQEVLLVKELAETASQHPYYKYNSKWSRTVQSAIGTAIYCAWLGGLASSSSQAGEQAQEQQASSSSSRSQVGRLLTLDEVGAVFSVPTNLKDRDAFHLSIEEYLLALTDFTQDLSRLATNAVTLGDFDLPMLICAFVKDLFAGFQLLNLKNDILRKRADAVKYDVKRVEDVVYDLSLRGLVPRPGSADLDMKSD
ncbi:hypothetical protein HIM_06757 [Hirsutella minnesotensis 3608]|uniref:Translin n=1 Tax=Hirsutella minnesotensis 3608 TaxID=1043627 RepID=A0A0F8A4N0_9HYPO|nr:hypothetical protein HIM_06757 [Hirsutella minnesotensis 3608]